MRQASSYIEELTGLHADIAETPGEGFREAPVICVDRHDREVHFTPAADIARKMNALLGVFADEYERAIDVASLSASLAKFYYGAIAIHPFMDANRRAAFAFLERRAKEKSYRLQGIDLLRQCLFEGDVPREMQKLTALFTHILKPA
jgi:hypothetical protein